MRYEVILPSLGEGEDAVAGGTVSMWLAVPGAEVREGDDLLELCTDKAAFIVPCPKTGVVLEQTVGEGDEIRVGDVLCVLDVKG
jgi:pyruvate/2-oxoglutarate dehydrogenase complex dihydrolipoamide acyltransferase (E2) component